MNRSLWMLPLLALAVGCDRKHDDGSRVGVGGILPGRSVTLVTKYGGSITPASPGCGQTCRQTVTVNADVLNYPADQVEVYLCKNSDCSAGTIPPTFCASAWNQPAAACYTSMPSSQITLGHQSVQFINASDAAYSDVNHTVLLSPGYQSYFIKTTVAR